MRVFNKKIVRTFKKEPQIREFLNSFETPWGIFEGKKSGQKSVKIVFFKGIWGRASAPPVVGVLVGEREAIVDAEDLHRVRQFCATPKDPTGRDPEAPLGREEDPGGGAQTNQLEPPWPRCCASPPPENCSGAWQPNGHYPDHPNAPLGGKSRMSPGPKHFSLTLHSDAHAFNSTKAKP